MKTNDADIWMPLYIGDFLADTTGLEAEKTGCYLLWLMRYWREGPLPNDIDELIETGKLRNPNALAIAQVLLNKFFTLGADNLWHQKRADQEMLAAASRQQARSKGGASRAQALTDDQRRQIARSGAASRWAKKELEQKTQDLASKPMLADMLADACSSPSPSPSPSPSQTKSKDEELSLLSATPMMARVTPQSFFELWNERCGPLPKVEKLNEDRQKKLRLRIKQGLTLEHFSEAIENCRAKPFLSGKNDTGWTATFDWLIRNETNSERAITEAWGSKTNGGGNGTGNGKTHFADRNEELLQETLRGATQERMDSRVHHQPADHAQPGGELFARE